MGLMKKYYQNRVFQSLRAAWKEKILSKLKMDENDIYHFCWPEKRDHIIITLKQILFD